MTCTARCAAFLTLIFSLKFAAQISAQSIPARGSEATLDVATWNIVWFGSTTQGPPDDALQFAHVRAVIEGAGMDLWAVQEISDEATFHRLLDSLGTGYGGVLATRSGTQRIGFIYRTAVIAPRGPARHILEDFAYDFAGRPPLQLEADVRHADTTVTVTFITLHMKCCGGSEDHARRAEASRRLKNHLDFLKPHEPVIVLGDFNDGLLGSISGGRPSPYDNFVQDTAAYALLSLALEQEGQNTWCRSSTTCSSCDAGSPLDHLLITDELVPHYVQGSAGRYTELLTEVDHFTCTTSDHLPVYASFQFARPTATPLPDVPAAAALTVSPNPFRSHTTLAYALARPGAVEIDVYDLLGRRVTSLVQGLRTAGEHRLRFDASHLRPGLYLIRLRSETVHQAEPVTILP